MITRPLTLAFILLVFAAWMPVLTANPLYAQERARVAKADAPLVVEGSVRQVFRSPRQGRTDYLVQIDVLRSEGRKIVTGAARQQFPGPGESVYVHISERKDAAGRPILEESYRDMPGERSQVRAYLTPREKGGWEGAFPDWFEVTNDRLVDANPEDAAPSIADNAPASSGKSSLGMTTELLKVQNRIALRVTSVERGGPAQKCGLEVGDVIAGAEGAAITDAQQIEALGAKGKKFSLIVIDVNTGKGAQVEIDPSQQPRSTDEAGAPPAQPSRVSLGMSADPVSLGSRSAVQVTRVDPDGPAAKAGLEPGDIVVAANGAPITGPEQLLGALRKSGPTLKLTVRDSRTGRDTEVVVNLSVTAPAKPLPAEVETPLASSPGKVGAVTELAFHDDDFAVKVTEIETGSPAAKAGLRPGVMILSADGKPTLHPNDLNDAVRKSSGTLKLTVLDPISGKKKNIDVFLGR